MEKLAKKFGGSTKVNFSGIKKRAEWDDIVPRLLAIVLTTNVSREFCDQKELESVILHFKYDKSHPGMKAALPLKKKSLGRKRNQKPRSSEELNNSADDEYDAGSIMNDSDMPS